LALPFVPTVEEPIRPGIDPCTGRPVYRPDDTAHGVAAMPMRAPCRPAQWQGFAENPAIEPTADSHGIAALDIVVVNSHNGAELDWRLPGAASNPPLTFPSHRTGRRKT
jgi:hypothetical protein